ncbi:M1 family metallopeptidase [Nonomuraea sp. NN258]|uniref:M1 family metallopeptidase n=1 Tax=Nonomuraea antri TaxID=2730852 RepID=UPI001569AD15|nr:M1 family metallopeptidase [Nonomuraea antri]NRQ36232.1 M1 family metallopeptidase [Nonomuraea antri]
MRRPLLLLLSAALAVPACSAPASTTSSQPVRAISSASLASPPKADPYVKGLSRPVADPLYPAYGNPSIDVLHYGLKLGWQPSSRTLTGRADITLRATKAVTSIRLDFGRALKVDGATVAGKPVKVTRKGDDLTLHAPLKADGRAVVSVRYHGVPKVTNARQKRADINLLGFHIESGGRAWALQEPFGSFTWFPVNDHPSDEALYDVAITVPNGWSGVAHGTYKGKTTSGGKSTFRWQSRDPVASYLTVFAADKFRLYRDKGPRGVPITYWIRPGDVPKTLKVAKQTPAIMKWLEKRLGAYPFPTAGIVVTSDSGMETQQMITLGPPYMTPGVVAHELAHHWFGDTVTPRTWRDLWMNEGFAMYFELQYYADHGGGTIDELMDSIRGEEAQLRKKFGPPGKYRKDSFAESNVYYGPALMLHDIRERVGDDKFFAMTRAWPQQHRNTTQDRASFTKWINDFTGEDLTDLIDSWLDGKTSPR